MTPAPVCASCGRGDRAYLRNEHGSLGCVTCARHHRSWRVDLALYRRHRPAGPVPCFTGPQEPAEVLLFSPRERHEAGAD